MIPANLLPHTVDLVRPAVVTDEYNNEVYDYVDNPVVTQKQVWIQQDARNQLNQDAMAKQGRYSSEERWLLISNDSDFRWQDRVIWEDKTFVVYSQPEPCYTPGGYHHLEATLQIVLD